MSDASTPLMRQYNGIKQQVPNALLMFRLGDFYELFFEDAVVAARELEITLTSRNKEKGAAIPMCGVPFHAAEGYISRLIQKGYRVAICDQVEDPKSAKGLVKREIMRVVTPGTAMDATLVRSRENNFLAAVCAQWSALRRGPRRCLHRRVQGHRHGARRSGRRARTPGRARSPVPDGPAAAHRRRTRRPALRAHRTRRLGLHPRLRRPHAARSLQTALARWLRPRQPPRRRRRRRRHPALPARHAARRARPSRPPHLLRPRRFHGARRRHRAQSGIARAALRRRCRRLAGAAHRARRARSDPHRHGRPPAAPAPAAPFAWIAPRSSSASTPSANCASRPSCAPNCASSSRGILDLERLLAKVTLGSASPRDVLALGRSLEKIPALKRCFDTQQAARLRNLHDRLDELTDVADLILRSHRRRTAAQPGGWRHDPRRLPSPNSTNCATSARTASSTSRRSKPASASAPASPRSRCASTTSSATTSRSRRPISTWRPPTTSASRRWSTPSASPRPS